MFKHKQLDQMWQRWKCNFLHVKTGTTEIWQRDSMFLLVYIHFGLNRKLNLIYRPLPTYRSQEYFHTKIFSYIFHIKPFLFSKHSPEVQVIPYQIFLKFSHLNAELIGVYLNISLSLFELLFTSSYDLNININSDVTIFYDHIVRFDGKNQTLCLNHVIRKSINKILWKL